MATHRHPATIGFASAFWAGLPALLVALFCVTPVSAFTAADEVVVNNVVVTGIDDVLQLKPEYGHGILFDELVRSIECDGYDQILLQKPDGALWLVYGRNLLLYAQEASRVHSASVSGTPVQVLYVDKESGLVSAREPMGRWLVISLILIVIAGFFVGVVSGFVARRNLALLGRNPMYEHMLYGLAVGFAIALLVYGLSDKRFEVDVLLKGYNTEHMRRYSIQPD
jgi:hypothetical protein